MVTCQIVRKLSWPMTTSPPLYGTEQSRFARFLEHREQRSPDPVARELRRRLLAGLRGRVLEIGCGDGRAFELYPPAVTSLLAVEPDPTARAAAASRAGEAPIPIDVVDGVASALPADDESYDAAVLIWVLCSVPDPSMALLEIRRVLVPGGELRFYEHVRSRLRWSAHDYMPADGLPYIGRMRRRDDRVYVATGFAKWGLTKGMIAARIITDAIVGRPNPWTDLYDPGRVTPRASAKALVVENARVARHFLGDRLRPRAGGEVHRLAPGEGAVLRVGGRHFAVYRDDTGTQHVLSARCPHLGCLVEWSEGDETWECP